MSQETLTLLTTIGTFLAVIATFLTVLEMRWQRRTTYKPDLMVESTGFDIYPDGTDHFGIIATDRTTRPAENASTQLFLTARNAGFGPAKNVTYSWETDLQDFLESIGRVDASVVESAEYDAGRLLRLVDSEKRDSYYNLANQLRGRLPVIMPDVSSGLYFPSAYLRLLMLSLNARAKRETQLQAGADVANRHLFDMGAFDGWPPLTLTLSCKDLGGYEHRRRFTVQPEVAMLHFGDVSSKERSASIAVCAINGAIDGL
jgi:hypothetical protein